MDNYIEENIRCHMDKMALSFGEEIEGLKTDNRQLKEEIRHLKEENKVRENDVNNHIEKSIRRQMDKMTHSFHKELANLKKKRSGS